VVFPELIAEMRLVSALSNELWLLDELDVEEVDDAVKLEIKELTLCKLVMDINGHPFPEISQRSTTAGTQIPEYALLYANGCPNKDARTLAQTARFHFEND
jgi:hypothetical protein